MTRRPITHGRGKGAAIYHRGRTMAKKFKKGDSLQHDYQDAIAVQIAKGSPWGPLPRPPFNTARTITVGVMQEESPGKYRCTTDMGITILIDETELAPIEQQ